MRMFPVAADTEEIYVGTSKTTIKINTKKAANLDILSSQRRYVGFSI
jgi:hypothetical protein